MMHSQKREQGRIALGWKDVKKVLIDHLRQSGEMPPGVFEPSIEAEFWNDDDDDPTGPTIEITFSSVWDKTLGEESGYAYINDLENVVVEVKKLLIALRGHVSVLKTRKPTDEHERGRIEGWIDAHQYLERLVSVFSGIDPDREGATS